MTNFCPNCGNRLEPGAKFCPFCGKRLEIKEAQPSAGPAPSAGEGEIFRSLNIRREDLVGQWEVKVAEEWKYRWIKGFVFLTKDELILTAKKGVFTKKLKEHFRVSLVAIAYVGGTGFPLNAVNIVYAEKRRGLAKFIPPQIGFKIKDSKSFIETLKKLNPKIKVGKPSGKELGEFMKGLRH